MWSFLKQDSMFGMYEGTDNLSQTADITNSHSSGLHRNKHTRYCGVQYTEHCIHLTSLKAGFSNTRFPVQYIDAAVTQNFIQITPVRLK